MDEIEQLRLRRTAVRLQAFLFRRAGLKQRIELVKKFTAEIAVVNRLVNNWLENHR